MRTIYSLLVLTISFQLTALDLEAAKNLCRKIGTEMNNGDATTLVQSIDAELFEQQILTLELPDAVKAKMPSASDVLNPVAQQYAAMAQDGAFLDFLDIVPFAGAEHTGRFRIVYADTSGYIYFFLKLAEKDGAIVVSDLYTMTISSWMSDYLRQIVLLGSGNDLDAKTYNAYWKKEIAPEEKKKITAFFTTLISQPAVALESYQDMPDYVQQHPLMVATMMSLVQQRASQALPAALTLAEQHAPDLPLVQMFLFDRYSNQGQYDKASKLLDKIYQVIGEDGYYYYQQANLHYAAGKQKKAIKAYKATREKEPTFYLAYVNESFLYVLQKDYDKALEILKLAETNAGINFPRTSFTEDPDYAGMVATEAFQTWKPEPAASE